MSSKPNPDQLNHEVLEYFFAGQIEKWPMLGQNIDLLVESSEKEKEFKIDSSVWSVSVCSFEYRKTSATADVDKALSGERPCFLCENARPIEQKHIIWEGYDILANPYPLSVLHLTIAAHEHQPQLIEPHIRDMARLTRVLPDHAVFYNGPRCGASAPDHLHFQAIDKRMMYNFTVRRDMLMPLMTEGKSSAVLAVRYQAPFPYIHILAAKDSELVPMFKRIMAALPAADPEPMVNVIAWKDRKGTSVVIIPRRAHRPECYGTGEGEILVSPATLEMAGFFTCSRPEDVDKLDEETVQKIYDDVCLTNEDVDPIYEKLHG